MQTKVEIGNQGFWLDQPEVTRLEVLLLLGYGPREAISHILIERGAKKCKCQLT